MSRQATDWAWSTKLRGPEKLVLLTLAHRANAEGVCWPSIDRIADDCGVSRRAAINALNALVAAHIVARDAVRGRTKTNRYRILIGAEASIGAGAGAEDAIADHPVGNENVHDVHVLSEEKVHDVHVLTDSGAENVHDVHVLSEEKVHDVHVLTDRGAENVHDVHVLSQFQPGNVHVVHPNQVSKKERKKDKVRVSSQADEAVAIWNQLTADRLPAVRLLTDFRRKMIDDRIADTLQGSIDQWRGFIEVVIASDFLTGRSGKWSASFDWCVKRNNMIKILEGNYANRLKAKVASRWDIDDCLLGDNPFDSDPFAAVGASNVDLNRFH